MSDEMSELKDEALLHIMRNYTKENDVSAEARGTIALPRTIVDKIAGIGEEMNLPANKTVAVMLYVWEELYGEGA